MANNNPFEPVNLFTNSINNRRRNVDEMMANSFPASSFSSPDSNRLRNIIEPLHSSNLNVRKFTCFTELQLKDLSVDGKVENRKGYMDLQLL